MYSSLITNLRKLFFGRVVYPAVVTLRGEGSVFRRLASFKELETKSREELESVVDRKLATLIDHACSNVQWYRKRLDLSSLRRGPVRDAMDEIPQLTKTELQQHSDHLMATGRYRTTQKITGGSTGQAVTVVKNRNAIAAEMAASWLGYGWFGIEPGDKGVRFWGNPTTIKRKLRYRAADITMNRKSFSAFAFSEQDLDQYWDECIRFRPRYLYGYVSMIEQLARHILDARSGVMPLNLTSVITTAEVLSKPQRDVIQKAFRAPVQNEYGCGEVGPIAYECEEGSLHVMSPNVYVEILGEDGQPVPPGASGTVVITDLNNMAMPLIRYRVGDWAIRGEDCKCGRPFPTLEKIWGRKYDFILADDGRRYHGEFVMYLFEDARSEGLQIDQFTVAQIGPRSLAIRLVAPASSHQKVREEVTRLFRKRLPSFSTEIEFVDAIARRPSGKAVLVSNPWIKDSGRES